MQSKERELVIIPRRIPAALITLVQTRRGQSGEQWNNGRDDSHSMPGLSLIRPSLILQLDSQNPTQQSKWIPAVAAELESPGAPLWAGPGCNVLGNVISAIGVLIVSIFYQTRGDWFIQKMSEHLQSAHCLPGVHLCFWLCSSFSVSPQVPFLLSNSPFPSVQVKHQDH